MHFTVFLDEGNLFPENRTDLKTVARWHHDCGTYDKGFHIGSRLIKNLRYADDIVWLLSITNK